MRLIKLLLIVLLPTLFLTCGSGSDTSGKLDKSGAAGPHDNVLGDAPPPSEGPVAVEVRYLEQMKGITILEIDLKADKTFTITKSGYTDKSLTEVKTARWDTQLLPDQTEAIMEACTYEMLTKLAQTSGSVTPDDLIGSVIVKFADGEEISYHTGIKTRPPDDFRAIAHTMKGLAEQKMLDTKLTPAMSTEKAK